MANIITDTLDAQGVLNPGEHGYWKVWGAKARDIQIGDLLMVKWKDTGIKEYKVAEVDHSTSWLPLVTAEDGSKFQVGALQPIVLLREGTHNMLAR